MPGSVEGAPWQQRESHGSPPGSWDLAGSFLFSPIGFASISRAMIARQEQSHEYLDV
jgi:hypothetical protein